MIHSRPGRRIILVLCLFFRLASSAVIPCRPAPNFAASPAPFEISLGQVLTLVGRESRAETAGDATSMSDDLATVPFSNQGAGSKQGAGGAGPQLADPAAPASQTVAATAAAGTVLSQPSGALQAPRVGGVVGGAAADPTTTGLAVLPAALPSSLLTPTTSVITATTDVAITSNGIVTTVPMTIISTSTGLVPIATTPSVLPAALPSILLTLTTSVITATTDVAITSNGIVTTVPTTIISTSTGFVPIATTGGQASASKSASTSKTVAMAGGVVGAAIILIGGILLCVFFCKRRRALAAQRLKFTKEIYNPFDSESVVIDPNRESWAPYIDRLQAREDGLTPSNTVSTRQLYISNQVNRAREKVAELEEMSSLLLRSSRGNSLRSASDDPIPTMDADENEPANANVDVPESIGIEDKLDRAIRQIEELNNRIRELEMQRRSSWAMGLSDELPPGYAE